MYIVGAAASPGRCLAAAAARTAALCCSCSPVAAFTNAAPVAAECHLNAAANRTVVYASDLRAP